MANLIAKLFCHLTSFPTMYRFGEKHNYLIPCRNIRDIDLLTLCILIPASGLIKNSACKTVHVLELEKIITHYCGHVGQKVGLFGGLL